MAHIAEHSRQRHAFQHGTLAAKAHQLQQLQAQRLQPLCLVIHIVGRLFACALADVAAAKKVRVAQHGRHGGFDFVCEGGHKIVAAAHFLRQIFHGVLHRGGHGVKIAAQGARLVLRLDIRALAVLPGRDARGRGGKALQRAQQKRGEAQRQGRRRAQQRGAQPPEAVKLGCALGIQGRDVEHAHQRAPGLVCRKAACQQHIGAFSGGAEGVLPPARAGCADKRGFVHSLRQAGIQAGPAAAQQSELRLRHGCGNLQPRAVQGVFRRAALPRKAQGGVLHREPLRCVLRRVLHGGAFQRRVKILRHQPVAACKKQRARHSHKAQRQLLGYFHGMSSSS